MIDTQKALLKHFSSVLRKRANAENIATITISPELSRYLSRKELIAIITKKHEGKLPKELDLLSLENEELLIHIEDELFVISYVTKKWSEANLKLTPISGEQKTKKTEEKKLSNTKSKNTKDESTK